MRVLHLISIWIIAGSACAQESRLAPLTLNLPFGPTARLASPDGSHILYGVPFRPGRNDGPQLWIEDTRTHQRKKLLSVGDTLCATWAADGSAFSVEDHGASDFTRTYIYNVNTLQRLDLAKPILAADPNAKQFAIGHAYFDLKRWENVQEVVIHFHGHTDQSPVTCFDFRYRVSRGGDVEKLSARVFPLGPKNFCQQ